MDVCTDARPSRVSAQATDGGWVRHGGSTTCRTVPAALRLRTAIERVESGGNPKAIGDSGKAVGILQIWPCRVDDVNRIQRLHGRPTLYTYADRLNTEKSREMYQIINDHYSRGASDEVIARRWNGSPSCGEKSPKTLKYWHKVQRAMRSIR